MTWPSGLFYLAFCCQILLVSYYFPKRVVANIDHVLTNFPPDTHPKLYPGQFERYIQAKNRFAFVCRCIFIGGLLLIPALMFLVEHKTITEHGFISPAWPAGYGMLQFLPFVVLALSEFSYFKQMRQVDVSTTRVAVLRRRNLSDYIHPLLILGAIGLWVTFILIDFYVNNSTSGWSSDSVLRAVVTGLTNSLFIAIGAFKLYGPKQDPHQSNTTRARLTSIELKILTFGSMAVSLFMAFTAINDALGVGAIDALIVSLYLQVIAVVSLGYALRKLQPQKQDFDVYREYSATG